MFVDTFYMSGTKTMAMNIKQILGIFGCAFVFSSLSAADLIFAGDSTLAPRKPYEDYGSWGDALLAELAEGVKILNFAESGMSTKSFRMIWEKRLMPKMKKNDWVIVQFGINDPCHTSKDRIERGEPDRYCELPEYRENLRRYVADIRAKKAKPIFCTPITSRAVDVKTGKWSEGLRDGRVPYSVAMREIAEELNVPLVDMEMLTIAVVKHMDAEASKTLFMISKDGKDNTHPTKAGAAKFAEVFLKDVRVRQLEIAVLFKRP